MVKELVECTEQYWEFVRELRLDERVSDGFIQSGHITPEMQHIYMSKNAQYYRVVLADGKPAGYVGVIDNDIRICTHPDYQKKGLAKYMLEEIMKQYPDAYGKVKLNNEASKKLFNSVGFKETFVIFTR